MDKREKKRLKKLLKDLMNAVIENHDLIKLETDDSYTDCCGKLFKDFDVSTHEAWIMQCPKDLSPSSILNKRIKLPGRRSVGNFQVRASEYLQPSSQTVGYVNSKSKYVLRQLPIAGYVVMSKRLRMDKPLVEDDSIIGPLNMEPTQFKLPLRHPLFAGDYKTQIEIPQDIAKKLKKADKKSMTITARLRKRANYWQLRRRLLRTAQTLEQKEHAVRQSVLTGVVPDFMKKGFQPTIDILDLTLDDDVDVKKESIDSGNESAPATKSKKRKSNAVATELVAEKVTKKSKKSKAISKLDVSVKLETKTKNLDSDSTRKKHKKQKAVKA